MSKENKETKKIKNFDYLWTLSMFGTAIGAGILFLPIRAGLGGIYPVLIMLIIAIPMVYLSHRGLARFVKSSKEIKDITEVADESFGKVAGGIISLLYLFAVFPICLAYGVGITNTVYNFLINQLNIEVISRTVVAIVFITAMMYVMARNREFMLKLTCWLVYPLISILFLFSLYLIPQWNLALFQVDNVVSFNDMIFFVIVSIPILVFSFNHSPAISSFVIDLRKQYSNDEEAEERMNKILFRAAIIITGFALFFTISCTLTLTPEQLTEAKEQNISILSYFANKSEGNLIITYLGPIIAFTAIFSSFFGHYLAAQEGFKSLIYRQVPSLDRKKDDKKVTNWIMLFAWITIIVVAIINPSILGFIEDLGGPFIAMILFLMPLYGIYKIPSMKKYSKNIANLFVFIIGALAVSGIIYKVSLSIISLF